MMEYNSGCFSLHGQAEHFKLTRAVMHCAFWLYFGATKGDWQLCPALGFSKTYQQLRRYSAAYKQADGKKLDNRRVLVDVERGRTVPNWRPRRLGSGLGTTRIGGEDLNQKHSGRERERSHERGREREWEKSRERSHDRPRDRDHRCKKKETSKQTVAIMQT